jgi:ribosomal protein S27AE
MPQRPCPLCGQPGRFLADVAKDFSTVDYYRCDPCGFVWWHRKHDPDAPAVAVTKPPAVIKIGGRTRQPAQ